MKSEKYSAWSFSEKGPKDGLNHQCKLECKSQPNLLGTTPNFLGSKAEPGETVRAARREGKREAEGRSHSILRALL